MRYYDSCVLRDPPSPPFCIKHNGDDKPQIIFHTIGATDLLHPSPAPHLSTFNVSLIYFPKCRSFNTIHNHDQNVAFLESKRYT